MSHSFAALCILLGTIIGAGILGMPGVIMKSGFSIGLIEIIFLGAVMCIVMLYLGEIVQRTKQIHQLPGYAEKYLGKSGKNWMFIALAFGIYSAIVAYLIAEGRCLSYIIFDSPEYSFQLSLFFWFVISFIAFLGIKAFEESEMVGVTFAFVMIVSIAVYFANKISPQNLLYAVPSNFFSPFGVILFAFLGFAAIPEIARVLGRKNKAMKKIIISAYAITTLIYIIFTAVVLGVMGKNTPDIATISLGKPFIVLGMITMFTAYLSLTIAMIDTFRFDYKKSKLSAWLYAAIIPLAILIILELSEKATFTNVLSIGGIVSGGLTAILILSIVKLAKQKGNAKPAYSMPYSKLVSYILSAIFIIAAVLEIKNLIF